MRHILLVTPPTIDTADPVPPATVDAADLVQPPSTYDVDPLPPSIVDDVDLVPPLEGEIDVDAESETFGGSPVDISLLPMYSNHIVRHICDRKVTLVGFINLFFTLIY